MNEAVNIVTGRFLLRVLVEDDVTERYLSWFRDDDVQSYIESASSTTNLADLRMYINERAKKDDVLFLGIFCLDTNLHIGNIKFEPIDRKNGYAIMGVMIGDPIYRNKGVFPEIMAECSFWMRQNYGLREIILGVASCNKSAIKSYQNAGFIETSTPYLKLGEGGLSMVLKT